MRIAPTAVLVVLFFARIALADIDPLLGSAGVNPSPAGRIESPVSMDREEVVLEIHPTFAIVTATFFMTGGAVSVTHDVGFPGSGYRHFWGINRPLVGLSATVDGAPVRVVNKITETQNTKVEWHTFSTVFPPNQKTIIRVRYGVVAEPVFTTAAMHVPYVLATGAGWKGPINGVHIVAVTRGDVPAEAVQLLIGNGTRGATEDCSPYHCPFPAGWQWTRSREGVTCDIKSLEPNWGDDIDIRYLLDEPDRKQVPSFHVIPELPRDYVRTVTKDIERLLAAE
jgi:hypothetical protein